VYLLLTALFSSAGLSDSKQQVPPSSLQSMLKSLPAVSASVSDVSSSSSYILCLNLACFRAATLWHHDHAVGITSENVYDGVFLSTV
jgi:hypothetical protein